MKPQIGSVSPSNKRRLVHDQATVRTPEQGHRNATSPRMGTGGRSSGNHSLGTQQTTQLVFRPEFSTPVQQESSIAWSCQQAGSTAESESGISELSGTTGLATPAAPVTPVTPMDSGYASPFSPFSAVPSTQPSVQSLARDGKNPAPSPLASSLPSVPGARRRQWNAGSPGQDRGRSDQSSNASVNSNSNSSNSLGTVAQNKERRSRSPVKALLDKAKRRLSAPARKARAEHKLPPSPAPATRFNSSLYPEFQYKQMARNLQEDSDSSSVGSPPAQSPPPRRESAQSASQDGQGVDSIVRVRRYTAPTVSPSKPATVSRGYVNTALIFSQCEVLISTLMNTASLQAKSVAVAQALEDFVSKLTLEHPDGEQLRTAFSAFQSRLSGQAGAAIQRNAVARGLLSQLEEAIQHFPNSSSTSADLFWPGFRRHLQQSAKDFVVWTSQ